MAAAKRTVPPARYPDPVLLRIVHPNGLVALRSPRLAALGVPHVFTTRIGPGGRPFDLASPDPAALAAFTAVAGADPGTALRQLRQVHGAAAHLADALPPDPAAAPEGDALVGTDPKLLLGVYTADCVPILIATADGRRVAAIHAGWRGLLAGTIPAAVELLLQTSEAASPPASDRPPVAPPPTAQPRTAPPRTAPPRTAPPRTAQPPTAQPPTAQPPTARPPAEPPSAAIGPCLSLGRCEMGPDVAEAFESSGLAPAVHWPSPQALARGARPHVDVAHAARLQLERAGIRAIDLPQICTWRDEDLCYSHRRDVTHGPHPRTGRLGAWISPRPAPTAPSPLCSPPKRP